MIGKYRIVEQIGEGGMATVYKAFDSQLEREVAIKMIRSSAFPLDGLQQVLQRFEREAKVLAKLSHTNIISVIDYGSHEGSPYLVMTYQPGGTLKQLLGTPMPWQEAARLLLPVARALEYAHGQGVLHRDVKPSNILLTQSGDPMLSDFGLAKLLAFGEGHTLTATGISLGTPEYMAPEQGMGRDVDGRADVYALGVVLFELVTGKKPFTSDTPMGVILKHISEPLPAPRQFIPDLPFEVEQVLFRALEKEPDHRYPNMRAFAEALQHMAAGTPALLGGFGLPAGLAASEAILNQPVDSMAPTQREKAELVPTKKSRRPKDQAPTLTPDELPATEETPEVRRRKKTLRIGLGVALLLIVGVAIAVLVSAGSEPSDPGNSLGAGMGQEPVGKDQIGQLQHLVTLGKGSVNQMVLSPDGSQLAIATSNGVFLFDANTLDLTDELNTGRLAVSLAFSPDGDSLIVGTAYRELQVWQLDDLALTQTMKNHQAGITSVAFSPDGQIYASADSEGAILLWRLNSSSPEYSIPSGADSVLALAFSEDGQSLAAGLDNGLIKVWAVQDQKLIQVLDGHADGATQLVFSSDDTRLISAGKDGLARIWRTVDGSLEREIQVQGDIACVALSADGKDLLIGKRWKAGVEGIQIETGTANILIPGQRGGALGLVALPGGEDVIAWTSDGTINLVRIADGSVKASLLEFGESVDALAFSPDGAWLVTGGRDQLIRWWGAADGALNAQWQGNGVIDLLFAPDGNLVSLGQDGLLRFWQAGDGAPQRVLDGVNNGMISAMAVSPDGNYLATGQYDNQVYIRKYADGSLIKTLPGGKNAVQDLAFSANGQWLAGGDGDQVVRVWQVTDWTEVYVYEDLLNGIGTVFFSPDSQRLFANTWDGNGKVWRLSDGELEYSLEGLSGNKNGWAISPTGEWLISASYTRMKTWNVNNGALLIEIPVEGDFLQNVTFSPDGAYLAVGDMYGNIYILGRDSGE